MPQPDPEKAAMQVQLAAIRDARREVAAARVALESHVAGERIGHAGGVGALDPASYRRERDAALARLRRVSRP